MEANPHLVRTSTEVRMSRNVLLGLFVVVAGVVTNGAFELLPVWHDTAHYFYVAVVAVLVVRLRMGLERERALARTDALTGLANRRTLVEAADVLLRRMRRDGAPCTVLYLDVDRFKRVNDVFGHEAGDTLLREIAAVLQAQVRACDTVARLGGDEFVVLLEGEQGRPVVSRLHDALRRNPRVAEWGVGFSIGALTFRTPPASAEEMLRRTDAEMYVAKQEGGRVVYRVA